MFRPRHPLNRHPSLVQFLIKSHLQCQLRFKSAKKVYKGEPPRKNKTVVKPSPATGQKPPSRPESKTIHRKKGRDPLQGMREANEREKLAKHPPLAKDVEKPVAPRSTTSEEEKKLENANKGIETELQSTTSLKDAIVTPSSEPGSKQAETETESRTIPVTSSSESSAAAEKPRRRPIPPSPSSLSSRPPRGPPQSTNPQTWLLMAMAVIFAGGGAYLFFGTPKGVIPPTKDLSELPRPISTNVTNAIGVLQKFFGERCSTSHEDLYDFGGEGIMSIGKGMKPRAIVWPESTEEVEIILNVADQYNVPIIPYSGGTSLEG